ncbi:hypothetical protein BN59_01335 [Legionella massiliensis]|uniref:Uncharacterized protein n=1 Tax=Legionella massiliensis TaxID=1034943 RepID=A0A078KVP5_9GAMM|nr:hypothetical protein [Legionella massiliensis]CDZ77056.1 hypothetical protein BN59_01335 [Legionella massiliensis]CEE12794.1 hypothetical protein BN1094_01335 [Legionella massiliensis]
MDCTKKGISLNPVEPRLREPLAKEQLKPKGFAQCLETSCRGKTGDDYYWQHQQELQNSALQFKPLTSINKLNSQTLAENEPATDRKLSKLVLSQEFSAPIAKSETFIPDYQIKIWTQEFSELINSVYDKSGQFSSCDSNEFSQEKLRPSAISEPLANKVFTRPLVFKNHQLFIRTNEAEFSLNSADLNKEQIKELSLLVKQWLSNKGIKLEHLIINGVKQ